MHWYNNAAVRMAGLVLGGSLIGQLAGAADAVEVIVDDKDKAFEAKGEWPTGAEFDSYKEDGRYTQPGQGKDVKAVWSPDLKQAGEYEVFVWIGSDSAGDHATDAPFTVNYAGGSKTIKVDMTKPDTWGKWKSLGTFKFEAGNKGNVTLTTEADGNVCADAVKFVLKK